MVTPSACCAELERVRWAGLLAARAAEPGRARAHPRGRVRARAAQRHERMGRGQALRDLLAADPEVAAGLLAGRARPAVRPGLVHPPRRRGRNGWRRCDPGPQGKVRDVHDAGGERLLIVASDRISAYDVVCPRSSRIRAGRSPGSRPTGSRRPRTSCQTTCSRAPGVGQDLPGGRCWCAAWRCCPSSAWCGATWPGRAGATTATPARCADTAARRACARPTPCPSRSSPLPPRPRGPRREHQREQAADLWAPGPLAEAERIAIAALRPRRGAMRGRRDHPGRHQVRARARRRRAAGAGRRGPHARLVAPLAGRRLGAGHEPPVVRQAVRARLARHDRLGPHPARARAAAGGGRGHPRAVRRGLRAHHRVRRLHGGGRA